MANIRVQLVDYDATSSDDVLDETITGTDGYFSLGPISNSEPFQGRQDLYLKMFAENDAVYVTTDYSDDVYAYKTLHGDDMLSGEYDSLIVVPIPASANFFIADYIQEIRDKWYTESWEYPDTIHVVNNEDSTGSFYNGDELNRMTIAGKIDNALFSPDYFDKSVIAHEYGHHITDSYTFFDASSGGTHTWDAQITSWLAADEGFATFWSSYFHNNPISRDYNNLNEYSWVNCENGEWGFSIYVDTPSGSANNYLTCEAAVAGILWDIYDDVPDDYSSYQVWPQSFPYTRPDSIGDSLSDGISNILSTLLYRNVDGHHPDNISEFWDAWFQAPSFGYGYEMEDIWYEHGILKTAPCDSSLKAECPCCIGIRGNVDGDPQDLVDISDMIFIVDFIFGNPKGPAPVCWEEGNADGDIGENVDISDLIYIVDFVFGNPKGPAPPSCP